MIKIETFTILVASMLIIFAVYFLSIRPHIQKYNRLRKNKAYEDSTNLWKNGASSVHGSYYLESRDCGKNWYAIDRGDSLNEWIVMGTAEAVYPGLLESLEAWDRLESYVKKNGPIGSSGAVTEKDLNALKGTGITVEKE